jgi:hypothetical protein
MLLCFLKTSYCGCGIKKCLRGFSLDFGSCRCRSQYTHRCFKLCPFGTYLNDHCECVHEKPCGIRRCVHPKKLDAHNCKCVSPHFPGPGPTGPSPSITSGKCRIKKCKPGFTVDYSTCKCTQIFKPNCHFRCPHGKTFEPGTCKCARNVCAIKSCESPAILNGQCECEMPMDFCDITCPEGTEFEFPCQCRDIKKPGPIKPIKPIKPIRPGPSTTCNIDRCIYGFTLNSKDCYCQGDNRFTCHKLCPHYFQVLNYATCECIDDQTCLIESCKYPSKLNGKCQCVSNKHEIFY